MNREVSEWGMTANRILMSLAYFDPRRGFKPLRELMPSLLNVKWEYVKMAEVAEAEGRPWTMEEFVDLCFDGFEKILGTAVQAHSQSGAPADAGQPLPSSEAA